MKTRSIGLSILFTIITCGIYGIYWMARITDEIGSEIPESNLDGAKTVLFSILTCGLYNIVWAYKIGEVQERLYEKYNMPRSERRVFNLILELIGMQIVIMALVQNDINTIGERKC